MYTTHPLARHQTGGATAPAGAQKSQHNTAWHECCNNSLERRVDAPREIARLTLGQQLLDSPRPHVSCCSAQPCTCSDGLPGLLSLDSGPLANMSSALRQRSYATVLAYLQYKTNTPTAASAGGGKGQVPRQHYVWSRSTRMNSCMVGAQQAKQLVLSQ
jgi:hypothetical protein